MSDPVFEFQETVRLRLLELNLTKVAEAARKADVARLFLQRIIQGGQPPPRTHKGRKLASQDRRYISLSRLLYPDSEKEQRAFLELAEAAQLARQSVIEPEIPMGISAREAKTLRDEFEKFAEDWFHRSDEFNGGELFDELFKALPSGRAGSDIEKLRDVFIEQRQRAYNRVVDEQLHSATQDVKVHQGAGGIHAAPSTEPGMWLRKISQLLRSFPFQDHLEAGGQRDQKIQLIWDQMTRAASALWDLRALDVASWKDLQQALDEVFPRDSAGAAPAT